MKTKTKKMTVAKFRSMFTMTEDVKNQIGILKSDAMVIVEWMNFFGFKVIDSVKFA